MGKESVSEFKLVSMEDNLIFSFILLVVGIPLLFKTNFTMGWLVVVIGLVFLFRSLVIEPKKTKKLINWLKKRIKGDIIE